MIQDDFGNLVEATSASAIHRRLDAGDSRMARIESDLSTNTQLTQQLATSTADLVEFFDAMKGALKVLNWIGKLARPLGAIATLAASLAGLWAVFKGVR